MGGDSVIFRFTKGGSYMTEIFRPTHGIYRCINNPANTREYVLCNEEGCFPVLVPVTKHPIERAKPSERFQRIYPAWGRPYFTVDRQTAE